MKEIYLTVTDLTFVLEGEILGRGRIIAASPGPERSGEPGEAFRDGTLRMGSFCPEKDRARPRGRWEASLEGAAGYALTFRDGRFLLSGGRRGCPRGPALHGLTASPCGKSQSVPGG